MPSRAMAATLAAVILFLAPPASGQTERPMPPIADRQPRELTTHGDTRVDDYFWLRDRESPDVIDYLEAENSYTSAVMAHTDELQETLFEEIRGRIKQDDSSVPYREGSYFYYTRLHRLHRRRRVPGRGGIRGSGTDLRTGRKRGRAAHGCHPQHAP